jgi:Zinc-binding dehydrogenase
MVPNQDDLLGLTGLLESGKVMPVTGRTYPLSQAPEAIGYFAEGHARESRHHHTRRRPSRRPCPARTAGSASSVHRVRPKPGQQLPGYPAGKALIGHTPNCRRSDTTRASPARLCPKLSANGNPRSQPSCQPFRAGHPALRRRRGRSRSVTDAAARRRAHRRRYGWLVHLSCPSTGRTDVGDLGMFTPVEALETVPVSYAPRGRARGGSRPT